MTSLLIKMDVTRCSVNAGLNFRGTKLSRMAVEPRKPRKFSTAKIKVHTVYYCFKLLHTSVECTIVYYAVLFGHTIPMYTTYVPYTPRLDTPRLDAPRYVDWTWFVCIARNS